MQKTVTLEQVVVKVTGREAKGSKLAQMFNRIASPLRDAVGEDKPNKNTGSEPLNFNHRLSVASIRRLLH